MNRCLAAFLALVMGLLFQSGASGKSIASPAASKKLPAKVAPRPVKASTQTREKERQPEQIDEAVRTQSAVILPEETLDSSSLPEGALYTSSDECA